MDIRKKIEFYHQHTDYTCGPACALMILYLYRKIKYSSQKQEMMLYDRHKCDAFCGVTGAALADCLSGNGLQVQLLHSSENMMDNRDGYFEEKLFGKFLAEFQECIAACRDRIQVQTGVDITLETLKEALDAGKQIILECIVPGNADGIHTETLHWIVVYGYEGEEFLVCDPSFRKCRLTGEEVEGYMNTPIGKICLIIGGHE